MEDEAGSGELTEVQIGSAVEGEEDSTIACWRYVTVFSDGLVL